MELAKKIHTLAIAAFLLCSFPIASYGWGIDGHEIICKLAQSRLTKAAADAVLDLLPAYANNDLSNVCLWADRSRFRLHWSAPLHYIDTPDKLCTYVYKRDCKDENGIQDRCVAGAINNYTTHLLTYGKTRTSSKYNLTEALFFLSHFMGDVHQPLHVGFTSDRGANTINVHWYTRKAVLHHVWDVNIIETAEQRFYESNQDGLVNALQKNISGVWSKQVNAWEKCNTTACPNTYASEGIKAACDSAYKDVKEDSVLKDDYFLTRIPVVNLRLAQGGVRLAATLNRIFG